MQQNGSSDDLPYRCKIVRSSGPSVAAYHSLKRRASVVSAAVSDRRQDNQAVPQSNHWSLRPDSRQIVRVGRNI
jgi:hypothetical protein